MEVPCSWKYPACPRCPYCFGKPPVCRISTPLWDRHFPELWNTYVKPTELDDTDTPVEETVTVDRHTDSILESLDDSLLSLDSQRRAERARLRRERRDKREAEDKLAAK